MFNYVYNLWFKIADTPSTLSFLNLWFYINIRVFKVKLSNHISFYINVYNKLKSKTIKTFNYDCTYNFLVLNFILISFFTISCLLFII